MATLQMGNKTLFTQTGSADPVMSSDITMPSGSVLGMSVKTFRTTGLESEVSNTLVAPSTKGIGTDYWYEFTNSIPDISLQLKRQNALLALESFFILGEFLNYNPYICFKWMYQLNGTSGTWLDFDLEDTVGSDYSWNSHFFFGGLGGLSGYNTPSYRTGPATCLIQDTISSNVGDIVYFRCFKSSRSGESKFWLNRAHNGNSTSAYYYYGGYNTSGYKLYELAP